jgi:AsmA protein
MQPSTTTPTVPRRSRRLLRLAVACLLLLALGAFLLPFAARQMIGPERLRSLAEQALTDALGRQVRIGGEVSIILAPWFGLSMGPVTVAEAPDFGDGPMLRAGRLEMTIRMLPLLARVVSPGSVRVHDLSLHLRRNAQGRGNWDDLTAPATTAAAAPGWQVAPEPRDILVADASIDYRDEASGRSLAISGVRLKTGVGQPFNFSLTFRAEGFAAEAAAECHVQGKASFSQESGRFSLHQTLVAANLTLARPLVPGGATPFRVVTKATVDFDAATGSLALSDLDARALGARLAGTTTIADLTGAPKAEARLVLTADAAGPWREILGIATGRTPDSLVAAPVGGAPKPSPSPSPDAAFTSGGTAEPGQLEAAVEATADTSGLRVSSFTLRLPQGALTASGAWKWGDAPVLDAAVTVEGADFARFPLPTGRSAWPWSAPWLAGTTLDARLELRRCALGDVAVTDAHVTAVSRNGRLRLYPVSAVLPGGVVSLDARLEPAPGGADEGLVVDVRAALDPASTGGVGTRTPTRVRVAGRLDAGGAKGAFQVQSPNPQTAARLLGQTTDLPTGAVEGRGSFAVAPGVGHLFSRVNLTDLETRLNGVTVRGQLGWDAVAANRLNFDLSCDSLDLDRLVPLVPAGDGGNGLRVEGRLRLDRVTGKGVEARNVAATLASAAGRLDGTVVGAELFGGKLTGKFEAEPSGRLTAALQLAGAETARLTGLSGGAGLSGPISVKASLEAAGGAKGKFGPFSASIEAESPQLVQGRGPDRLLVASPKAVLTLKGRDVPETGDSLGLDAVLTATATGAAGLRDIRLAATGPLAVDKAGRVKESGPAKVEASALLRLPEQPAKDVRIVLSGPVTVDAAGGGFTAGDLRLDAGGVAGTAKIWRKAGEAGPAAFSLETGNLAPRSVLAAWGVAVPGTIPADRLARASLSVSGTAGEEGLDIKRLSLALDDAVLTGHASLPKYDFRRGKWNLALDRLDCDAYFPQQPASGPPSLAERRKPLDLKSLREQAMELRLAIGWLKKGNVTFDATTIMANARGGLFTFRQESPRFYGGRFFAEIRGDVREGPLKTFIELKLEGFECARFLKDWAEGDTLSAGAATFILAGRTSGVNEEELRGNLGGNASLQVTRGNLKVREPGEPPTYEFIPFDVFSSSWFARGGVARSDDFIIEGPRMRVAGKGFVDLRDETINLSVTAALAGGSQVPATIIGPLDNPKLTIDRSKIIGDTVYRVLQGIVSIPGKAVTRILQIR